MSRAAEPPVPKFSDAERTPMLAACKACDLVWPFVWLPCDARIFGKVTAKYCPACGSKKVFVASRSAGDFERYEAQAARELARIRTVLAQPAMVAKDADNG